MPEIVLFETENRRSREDIAAYLRKVADNLDAGDPITLQSGEESVTVEPPAEPTFEVKVEREGPKGGPHERSIEFELEWDDRDKDQSGDLHIE